VDLLSRFRGSLLGLAVGDALGAPVEFETRGNFPPITGFRDGGPFNLNPGDWTDDTSLALCLAESLVDRRDRSPTKERYVRWWKEGHGAVPTLLHRNTTKASFKDSWTQATPTPPHES
jgi:ADP-ribosyl-[dinitrogen reductase] hydrolase